MNSAVVPFEPRQSSVALAHRLSNEQVALITRTICKGASPDELNLFLQVCNRTGLDPFLKQIHAVFRNDRNAGRKVMTIQVGIDGYRLLADRTGGYAGSDEPEYAVDFDEAGKAESHPSKASVTVWKMVAGQRCSFTASARWMEYVPEYGTHWKRMPFLMLGKVAEALALRKAFPAELSGLYTREEMDQAGQEVIDVDGVVVERATGEIVEDAPKPRRSRQPNTEQDLYSAQLAAGVDAAVPPTRKLSLTERWQQVAADARDCGLDVPAMPEGRDAIVESGQRIGASLELAIEAGLEGLVTALEAKAIVFAAKDRFGLGEDLSYYQAANNLWRDLALSTEDSAF